MSREEIRAIRRAQKGDREAVQFLIETHQRQILGTLYRLLGPRFADELEDLLFGPSESGGVCTLAQARSGMDTLESCRMHAGISR